MRPDLRRSREREGVIWIFDYKLFPLCLDFFSQQNSVSLFSHDAQNDEKSVHRQNVFYFFKRLLVSRDFLVRLLTPLFQFIQRVSVSEV